MRLPLKFSTLPAILAAALAVSPPGLAAQTPPPAPAAEVVGDWAWTAYVNDEVVSQGTMRVVLADGRLTGSVVFPEGEAPLESVSYDGRLLRFAVPGPNGVIQAEGSLRANGTLAGTWTDAQGGQGTWTASKR
jgi:hypothetical protein